MFHFNKDLRVNDNNLAYSLTFSLDIHCRLIKLICEKSHKFKIFTSKNKGNLSKTWSCFLNVCKNKQNIKYPEGISKVVNQWKLSQPEELECIWIVTTRVHFAFIHLTHTKSKLSLIPKKERKNLLFSQKKKIV